MAGCLTTHPCLQFLPVGQLNATQRGGAITAHEQPKVTVCGDTREDRLSGQGQPLEVIIALRRLEVASSPSVLLPSVKSWLCIIFSTMSSASMRVSSTQVGWLSTESFFRLEGEGQNCMTGQ